MLAAISFRYAGIDATAGWLIAIEWLRFRLIISDIEDSYAACCHIRFLMPRRHCLPCFAEGFSLFFVSVLATPIAEFLRFAIDYAIFDATLMTLPFSAFIAFDATPLLMPLPLLIR
jgi:hypothetical protein